jgi:2-aminoadipate transaminase
MQQVRASEIRELLKLTQSPDIISFSGGLPSPKLFPIEDIKTACQTVLSESGREALQYTTTEGYAPLRRWVADRMNRRLGTRFSEDEILLTHGSQQAIDLTGKVFLDEDDVVLCESPTYLAAISAFRLFGCRFIEVPTDDDGMIPEELEKILATESRVKLIYTIPEFQNPTGRTWSLERKKAIVSIATRHGIVVLEDNPYGELRFEGDALPSSASFDTIGNVLCLGTFSKIFCPGYRIGWIASSRELIDKYVLVKQGTDLQCNTIGQYEIAEYLKSFDIDSHIDKIREDYRAKRDIMLEAMDEYFPEVVTYTRPSGGLFGWVTLPERIDARDLLVECLKEKVAFVPGGSFFPNGGHQNTLRINFSYATQEQLKEGIKRIASTLERAL